MLEGVEDPVATSIVFVSAEARLMLGEKPSIKYSDKKFL